MTRRGARWRLCRRFSWRRFGTASGEWLAGIAEVELCRPSYVVFVDTDVGLVHSPRCCLPLRLTSWGGSLRLGETPAG